ncbi:SIMC1 protein, partial [Polypterus senegalus]
MIEIADGSDSDDEDSDVEFVGVFNNPERCSSPVDSCLGTRDSESSSSDIIDLTLNDNGHYQRRRNKTNSFEVTEIVDDDVTRASVIGGGRPWILIEEPETLIDLTENTATENQRRHSSSHSVDVVELEDEELCSTHSEDSKHFLSFKDNPWVSGEIFKGSKMFQGDDMFSTSSLSLSSDSDCSFLLPTAYYLNDSRLEFLEQHDKKKETNYNLNALGEGGNSSSLNALGEISSPPENMYAPAYICNEEIEKQKEGCNQSEKIFSQTACSIQMSNEQTQMPELERLHPAGVSTVQWDWELLSTIMMDKERQLSLATQRMFLQYVVQTLSDDFQMNVILQSLQLSIVKSTLSCDKKFVNVRNVVDWLFTFVISSTSSEESKKQTENKNETFKRKDAQERLSMICLLQKMLKLAMEVDRSPTCSSSKLSQELFQSMANIVTSRQQRALFLTSLDSPLLCCKVLELYLNSLCLCKTTQPLSLNLILHFLHHARLPLDSEDNKIEQWDELFFLLQLMIQSYQEVVHENLRRSILDREKHFGEPPVLGNGDKLTEQEIEADFKAFKRRVSEDLGQPMNVQLETKCNLLQMLFIGFIQR